MRPEPHRGNVREAAAAWHDRLQENVSDETRCSFNAWLEESAEHGTAYASVDKAGEELHRAALDPQILALRHETALRLTRRTSEAIRPLRWAAAAVVVLLSGGGLIFLSTQLGSEHSAIGWLLQALHGNSGRYVTATGERLAVTLSDGSQVTLDTQSELKVSFNASERDVQLIRGQGYFEVAKDPVRPFVVEAQNRRFVAVGTAFDVRVDGQQVRVTMVEGTVRVERRGESGTAAIEKPTAAPREGSYEAATTAKTGRADGAPNAVATITAGEQLVTGASHLDQVSITDPERSTSWRRGQIIFENTRLGDAVAELNRYSEIKVELADRTLEDLRLSGAFATGRPNVFVEAITTYFPVQIASANDHAVVLSAKK